MFYGNKKAIVFCALIKAFYIFVQVKAGVAQLVERQPSKLNVAGSNPVSRSKSFILYRYGAFLLKTIRYRLVFLVSVIKYNPDTSIECPRLTTNPEF